MQIIVLCLLTVVSFAFVISRPQNNNFQQQGSDQCTYPANITCGQLYCQNASTIILPKNFNYTCTSTFILQAHEVIVLGGRVTPAFNISADIVTIVTVLVQGNFNITCKNYNTLDNQHVNLTGLISADNLTILPSRTISNSEDISFRQIRMTSSLINSPKIMMEADSIWIENNSSLTTSQKICLYKILSTPSFIKTKNITMQEYFTSMWEMPIDLVIFGHMEVQIWDSSITRSVLSIYSEGIIQVKNSIINCSSASCLSNLGLGKGLQAQVANDGTCSSGGSSAGYGTLSSEQCVGVMQYFMFLTHAFPYLSKGPYLCTGSGGYGYKSTSDQYGTGGGIIFIYSTLSFHAEKSKFLAEGGSVQQNFNMSSGSGGTIFLYTTNFTGNDTNFSAAGGASKNNNGSGAGGIVKISYETTLNNISTNIWVNVSQGYQPYTPETKTGSNGIYYGIFCKPGYYPLYLNCLPCDEGTYSLLGDTSCQQCPTAHDYYRDLSVNGIYNISQCFTAKTDNLLEILIQPGDISWLRIDIYIVTLLITVILGLLIKKKYKKKLTVMETDNFSLEDANKDKDIEETKILTQRLKMQRNIKFEDLMYHVHRITLFGSNNPQCPWALPQYPPQQIKKYILRQGFIDFSIKFNKVAKWTGFQKFILNLALLVYPLHWYYYDKIKKRKYRKLLSLLQESKEFNLINNYDFQDKNMVTIKISKNADYTICYFDFMVYDRADSKYFNLSSPYIITISGEGNFLRPFYLEDRDVFFNTLFYIVNKANDKNQMQEDEKKELFRNLVVQKKKQQNRNKLVDFLKQFNKISITLDLSAPLTVFIQTLVSLIDFLSLWNDSYFKELGIYLDLILMISNVKKGNLVSNEIHILTYQHPDLFEKFMRENLPKMNRYEKYDVKLGLFVYNPDQEITKINNERKTSAPNLKRSWIGTDLMPIDNQQQIQIPLVETEEDNSQVTVTSRKDECIKNLIFGLNFFRYMLMTHRKLSYDKQFTKFIVTTVILTECMLVFTWAALIEPPYIFANLVSPFIGLLWMVSGSYGIGKLFLMFNAMALLNQFVTLITYLGLHFYERQSQTVIIRMIIGSAITIFLKIVTIPLATKFLSVSRKLSTSKMFK